MDHAGTEHLDPALALAGGAALSAAFVALDIQLAARLGKGEMMGTEARHGPLAVDLLDDQIQRRLQVGHRHRALFQTRHRSQLDGVTLRVAHLSRERKRLCRRCHYCQRQQDNQYALFDDHQ